MTQVRQESTDSNEKFRESLGKELQAIYDVLVGCMQNAPSRKEYESVQAYFDGEGILDQQGNLSPTEFIKKEIRSWFDSSREEFKSALIKIQGEQKFESVQAFSTWLIRLLTPLKYQKEFFVQYYEKAEKTNNKAPLYFSIISQLQAFLIDLYEAEKINEMKFTDLYKAGENNEIIFSQKDKILEKGAPQK